MYFVFTNRLGRVLNRGQPNSSKNKVAETAEVRNVRFHDFRHSTATMYLSNDQPVERLTGLLGHSSYAVTKDDYSKAQKTVLRKMRDSVNDMVC